VASKSHFSQNTVFDTPVATLWATFVMDAGTKAARAFLTCLKANKKGWEPTRLGYSAKKQKSSTGHRMVPPLPHLVEEADIETVLRGEQVESMRLGPPYIG